MHLSLREIAQCVDAPEEFSVMRDFFGFSTADPINAGTISLREQIEAVRGKHIHLDFILVAPSDISNTDRRWLDHGINGTRVILKTVGIGIGRIRYYAIPKENADGYDVITSKWEAKELTRRYRGPNDDAMDIFIVPQYNVISRRGKVKTGICNIMGCEKDLYAFNGCVIGMRQEFQMRISTCSSFKVDPRQSPIGVPRGSEPAPSQVGRASSVPGSAIEDAPEGAFGAQIQRHCARPTCTAA